MSALAHDRSSRDDYVVFCERIRSLTSIELGHYRRPQMERRLRTFAEQRGFRRLDEYAESLAADRDALEECLDRMTINVSQLWRNPEQWDMLGRTLVPELAASGSLRAWSAGCSYGAEAYSLAALCREKAPRASARILGTDLDVRMVERARAGRFNEADTRTVPAGSLERWFSREQSEWVAKPELRQLVEFRKGDLLTDKFPTAAYDLVLCRNVVIYFVDDVRNTLHARLAATLRPGGYLVVGSTERVYAPAEIGLTPTSPFVYRKG